MSPDDIFLAARDRMLALQDRPQDQFADFQWPAFDHFNWVQDFFEPMARNNPAIALREVDSRGLNRAHSFAYLAGRADQVANFLTAQGIRPGDRVLVSLGNALALWEIMLGCIRLGAVVIPASILLQEADWEDRIERGAVRCVIAETPLASRVAAFANIPVRIAIGRAVAGWIDYRQSLNARERFAGDHRTKADDLLFLYFTSGTTAKAKLVAHSHRSYPVGHLTTMHWIGLRPGDVHLNLSSPGWAKHAWSSFFAPWNAQAEVLAYQYDRFDPEDLLRTLVRHEVTTFCAPPTVWRMLLQEDLGRWPVKLREAVSAGEPLNSEIIEQVEKAWGITVRDGFGQSETTAIIANPPGRPIRNGAMGRPLPGCPVVLLDGDGRPGDEGEICLDLRKPAPMLMLGYLGDEDRTSAAINDGFYRTGDIAVRDEDGFLTYVGRSDDVFKSSDYRISPFELESILLEHPAIVEAAVVPSADPVRLCVPKSFVVLAAGTNPDRDTALSIYEHVRARTAPFKRIRRIEFGTLPKTISGKIKRAELRAAEMKRDLRERHPGEFWEEDFANLRSPAAA